MVRRLLPLCLVLLLVPTFLAAQPSCTIVEGTYTTEPEPNEATGTGPWTLTATTGGTYSFVTFIPDPEFTFADLQQLSASFTSATGVGGGSPRLQIALDVNGNGTYEPYPGGDGNVMVHFGDSPDFTGDATELNSYSGVNLIGNEDAGRYETGQIPGGSASTTYSDALADAGSYRVLSVTFALDTFGAFGDRSLILNSINLCAQIADLALTKRLTSQPATPGGMVEYEIEVTNVGTAATSGTVTVVDDPGEGLTVTSMSGTGWDCTLATLTCTRDDALAPGASYEVIVVEGTVTAPNGDVTNSATVSGGGDADATNDSGDATFAVVAADIPLLDHRALLALCAILAVLGVRRVLS